MKYVECFDS